MTVLSDHEIRGLSGPAGMIDPFDDTRLAKVPGTISWGVSSYGYDMRLADEFLVCDEGDTRPLDPKRFDAGCMKRVTGGPCEIPPGGYALGRSLEYFRIPRDVLVVVFGKSTYARCGVLVNVTPLEPEWEGCVTISIVNPLKRPVLVYPREGIAQLVFLRASVACAVSYRDKAGRYQAQRDITAPSAQ